MIFPTGDTAVARRVRLRGAGLDALTARSRLWAILGATDLGSGGMGPGAIVCVRRFADPLPGSLNLSRPVGGPFAAWQRAASAALDRIVREAARPARGPVPTNAEAVVFEDSAELLACLAADQLDGLLAARWWWPALFGAGRVTQAIAVWTEAPRYVPAALGLLAERGTARAFACTLSHTEARILTRAVIVSYRIPALLAALDSDPKSIEASSQFGLPREATSPFDAAHTSAVSRQSRIGSAQPRVAPWEAVVPEADATLAETPRLLLGVGLMLLRSPDIAHMPPFAEALRQWAVTRGERVTADPIKPDVSPAEFEPAVTVPMSEITEIDAVAEVQLGTGVTTGSLNAEPQELSQGLSPGRIGSFQSPFPMWNSARAIETRLGGLFYLVNVGLCLELYGDFSSPARPGIALPLWDFVTILGRALLDDPHDDDPVWTLLAGLAGRDAGVLPGQSFDPPDEWRVPAGWLAPFPERDGWEWDSPDGRLRIRHPARFSVTDLPASDPQEQLARELAICGVPRATRIEREPVAASPLDRWTGWVVSYVRARLERAIGGEEIAAMLRARARVSVTASRIDIALSLAELPIAVRVAGLDRDPGWVPAAGRDIAFRFE